MHILSVIHQEKEFGTRRGITSDFYCPNRAQNLPKMDE